MTFLLHLTSAAIVLALFYPLVVLLLRTFKPPSALVHRIAWGGVLLVPFFAMSLPLSIPIISVAKNTVPADVHAEAQVGRLPPGGDVRYSAPVAGEMLPPGGGQPTFSTVDLSQESVGYRRRCPPEVGNLPPAVDIKQIATFLLLAVWFGGVAVVLKKRFQLHLKLVRFLKPLKPDDSPESERVRNLWQNLLRRHKISATKIPLLVTESLGPALVCRGLRYYLLIPQAACDELLSNERADDILCGILRHELAHYRNGDGFRLPFFRTLAAVLWFHPLVWKALTHYETAAEWCCDEFAYLRDTGVGSALLAETFLVLHESTESLALNINSFARFNTVDRVNRLASSETLGKEPVMKKFLLFTLLGLLFLCGTIHFRLVAQNGKANIPKFPLTFQSEEELAKFMETYTPSPTTPTGKRNINQEKLRMLALAVHNYSDATRFLPSSSTAEDGTGRPMHSWRVAILPYLDQIELYEKIRRDEPWDSEYNKQFHTQMPDYFRSPYLSDEQAGKGLTNYAAIVGNLREAGGGMGGMMAGMGGMPGGMEMGMGGGGMMGPPGYAVGAIFPGPNSWNTWGCVPDGTSNTILFAERAEPVCWMDPTGDVPIKVAVQGINAVKNGLGSLDGTGGINIVFCDGRVAFAPSMGPNRTLEAALTCNGGESWGGEPDQWKDSGGASIMGLAGIVTMDGEPLPDVQVVFMPTREIAGMGGGTGVLSNKDGQFQFSPELLLHLQSGEYRVWVFPHSDDPRHATFPKKYTSPQTTPLLVRLQAGKNKIDLELRSE